MFIAVLKQCGEGCDYTIGCGVKVVELQACTWDEAKVEARHALAEDYSQAYDHCLEGFTIFEVSSRFDVPVNAWYADISREEADRNAGREKEKRRLEYERLKREFGGN
jgi:hypothetical protein